MSNAALVSSFFAAMLYVISPGPAVLALIGIGASRGRRPAIAFVSGHLVGDTLWCGLAIFALVGAELINPAVFDLLAIACAAYLAHLGWRGLTANSVAAAEDVIGTRPLRRGLLFGLTNPKSYPVALAMFTALLTGNTAGLDLTSLPALIAVAFVGFVVADLILVYIVGTKLLRRLYLRHALWIIRATGALFLLFAAGTGWEAIPRLIGHIH